MTNKEGMTWVEWFYATGQAGSPYGSHHKLRQMWFDGIDPTEVKAYGA